MNFIEKSAITTKAYWLRVRTRHLFIRQQTAVINAIYRSCPNFAQ